MTIILLGIENNQAHIRITENGNAIQFLTPFDDKVKLKKTIKDQQKSIKDAVKDDKTKKAEIQIVIDEVVAESAV